MADYEAVVALIEAAARPGVTAHVGITATAPGFFGAQGRPIPQLPIRYPDLAEDMARQRVLNFEMEASALLVLAGLARCRAGVVCACLRAAHHGRLRDRRCKGRGGVQRASRPGLEALAILAEMDRQQTRAGADRLAAVALESGS